MKPLVREPSDLAGVFRQCHGSSLSLKVAPRAHQGPLTARSPTPNDGQGPSWWPPPISCCVSPRVHEDKSNSARGRMGEALNANDRSRTRKLSNSTESAHEGQQAAFQMRITHGVLLPGARHPPICAASIVSEGRFAGLRRRRTNAEGGRDQTPHSD